MSNISYTTIGPVSKRISRPINTPKKNPKRGASLPHTLVNFTAASTTGTADPWLVDAPANIQDGDLLLLIHVTKDAFQVDTPPTGGSVWTILDHSGVATSSLTTAASTDNQIRVSWKIAGAAEPAQYSVDVTNNGTPYHSVHCLAFRGPTTVADSSLVGGTDGVVPSLVATKGDTLVVYHGVCLTGTGGGSTPPTGMTHISKTGTINTALRTAYEIGLSNGATGSRTFPTPWTSVEIANAILLR